jgi:hypothetical protein
MKKEIERKERKKPLREKNISCADQAKVLYRVETCGLRDEMDMWGSETRFCPFFLRLFEIAAPYTRLLSVCSPNYPPQRKQPPVKAA